MLAESRCKVFYTRFWPFSRWTNWRARHQGKKDAQRNFPPENAEKALGYPAEVEGVANQILTTVEARYNKRDRLVLERLKHASVIKEAAKTELDEAEEQYANQPRRSSIGKLAHRVGLLFFTVADVPLNLPPFEFYFRESVPISWLLALVVGFSLVVFAYHAGKLLREPNRTRAEMHQMVGASLGGCIIICFIAMLRESVLTRDVGGSAMAVIGFVFLQFLIFFAAGFWSYFAHNPLRDKRIAYQITSSEVDLLQVRREKLFRISQSEAERVIQIAHFLSSSYEGENIKYREGTINVLQAISPRMPICLTTIPTELDTKESKLVSHGKTVFRQRDSEVNGRY